MISYHAQEPGNIEFLQEERYIQHENATRQRDDCIQCGPEMLHVVVVVLCQVEAREKILRSKKYWKQDKKHLPRCNEGMLLGIGYKMRYAITYREKWIKEKQIT